MNWLTHSLQRLSTLAATSILCIGMGGQSVLASDPPTGPVVKLFPTTVVEDIRATSDVAAAMESSLQSIIDQLDLQQQLYTESACADAYDDAGCQRIEQQIGATYLQMLETMSDHLPSMQSAVANTRSSLENRLHDQLGKRTSPTQLKDLLLGSEQKASEQARSLALRGRSGLRLSDRFSRYYQLVATSGSASSQSLSVIAADIYLDMQEAESLISATMQEISRATLMEQLNQSFGAITPEMAGVVNGVEVHSVGDASELSPLAAPPLPGTESGYSSPLEF